jgi:thymidylate kinase
MKCDASRLLELYFQELDRRAIPCVILHGYEHLPGDVGSDLDYAVAGQHLAGLARVLDEVARPLGWRVAQTLQHGLTAFYTVAVNLENPAETLKLDACSDYARIRRLLVPEALLLEGRRRFGSFWIPAPAAEFIYELAKMYDAKKKDPADYLPRLRQLWEQDREGAQRNFTMVFGETGRKLDEWFAQPAEAWHALGPAMFARNRYSLARNLRELGRIARRTLHPTGFVLAVLGCDGAGKSTAIRGVRALLEPCFRHERVFHFRPRLGQKDDGAPNPEPHGEPPRGMLASILKLFYYFTDYWLGWFVRIWPAKVRSSLIIFDRHFEDILVDPRRYRFARAGGLSRLLAALVPRPDLTIVLDAPPEVLLARKTELPQDKLARQCAALRALAARPAHLRIAADQTPDQVMRDMARAVIERLASRKT